ncbi:MAG: hypothetical protein Q8Q12_05245, partial [bacterium]|nr:hypothetical protein [bacterium]
MAYLLAAGHVVALSRNQINPDAVVYVQVARHYAEGRFDLAVNSSWAPLLSWLLAPLLRTGVEPLLILKVLGILFGLGFAFGVERLVGAMNNDKGRFVGFAAALMLALTMLPTPVTPDLLLACLLSWYLAGSVRLIDGGGWLRTFATGLVGGLAYLAKHYALPFVAAHLSLTFALKRLLVRRGLASGQSFKPFATAMAGTLLLALPWVAVISVHDGMLTVGSAGRFARDFSPTGMARPDTFPHHLLHRPRAGRMAVTENPIEVRASRPLWSPLEGLKGIKYQMFTLFRNGIAALGHLKSADPAGLLMCGLIVSFLLLFPLRHSMASKEGVVRFWALASVAMYVIGYCLLVIYSRFLWPMWGMLVALSIRVLGDLQRGSERQSADEHSEQHAALPNATRTIRRKALTALLLISIAYNVLLTIEDWRSYEGEEANWFRESARKLHVGAQVAANEYSPGLYVSYWNDSVFLGQFAGDSPEEIAEELSAYGRTSVLVFKDIA